MDSRFPSAVKRKKISGQYSGLGRNWTRVTIVVLKFRISETMKIRSPHLFRNEQRSGEFLWFRPRDLAEAFDEGQTMDHPRCCMLVSIEIFFCIFPALSSAGNSIKPPHFLSDGQTLISMNGSFELGFFSPGSSKNRYLGVWYKSIPAKTVVWVANREAPVRDTGGSLRINRKAGRLEILSGNYSRLWSSNSTRPAGNPVAQLLDSGNLVLRDERSFLWQSFDYPSDTLLPGMKVGWDLRTGFRRILSSWKSADDPSPGELRYGIELHPFPEPVLWRGSGEYYRSGPWNGMRYSGAPEQRPNQVYRFDFRAGKDEVYYVFELENKSVITRFVMNATASAAQRYVWVESERAWKIYLSLPRDICDDYNLCGGYGICDITGSPVCRCLEGFEPRSPGSMDWSKGCTRSARLSCTDRNGFAVFDGIKFPDTRRTFVDTTMNLAECRARCVANCSCSAYANTDLRGGGGGCVIWFGDLLDMRLLPVTGQRLYIRMPYSKPGRRNSEKKIVVLIAVATLGVICGMLVIYYYIHRYMVIKRDTTNREGKDDQIEEPEGDLDLPFLDLATIAIATDDFSLGNRLGEGGFGPVYKGTLTDGQEIAVKRLSLSSGQGSKEFRNEVTLIAKLQHRNLVRLLACCVEGQDKMLVYEYMPNKSLDLIIFDPARAKALNWPKRFQIICGIARGLLYLHQDSRLRIVHRDLKASNVLLDDEMNPKISDFGLARSFGNDKETTANTQLVVGTYGYMAPEYAVDGLFSIKSDVFSFGVLLLEIVSGKKNRGFHYHGHGLNLSGHAWRMWKEGRCLEVADPSYGESRAAPEIFRCVHIGLLCVQEQAEERPDMAAVILMLSTETPLVEPKQPGFFVGRNPLEEGESSSSKKNKTSSTNEISVSLLEAR